MTMGIEQFRNLTTQTNLENRRVTVDELNQVTAPKSLWGRLVNWFRGNENRGERGQLNQRARETFYNALVKSSNPDFAEKVIKRVYGDYVTAQNFKERTTNLQVSRVKQILDTAREMRGELRIDNETKLKDYVGNGSNGRLSSVVETMARGENSSLGHPLLKRDDKDVQREFRRLVRLDPDYRHHTFTDVELDALARKAVARTCEIKRARFDEQYPQLAQIKTTHFHDSETYFQQMRQGLNVENDPGDAWIASGLERLKQSTTLLGRMDFSPEQARALLLETTVMRDQLQALKNGAPGIRDGELQTDMVLGVLDLVDGIRIGPDKTELPSDQINLVKDTLQTITNEFLDSRINNIADETVRGWMIDQMCRSLDDQLLTMLAPKGLLDERAKLLGERSRTLTKQMNERDVEERNRFGNMVTEIDHQIAELDKIIVKNSESERRKIVRDFRNDVETRLVDDPRMEQLRESGKKNGMQYRIERECDNQIAKLSAKISYLTGYLDDEPGSEKSIARDKLLWAQATQNELVRLRTQAKQELKDLMELGQRQRDGDILTREQERKLEDYDDKIKEYNKAIKGLKSDIGEAQSRVNQLLLQINAPKEDGSTGGDSGEGDGAFIEVIQQDDVIP